MISISEYGKSFLKSLLFKNMRRVVIVLFFFAVAGYFFLDFLSNNFDHFSGENPLKHELVRVAHAGGGVSDGAYAATYTNSIDALESNVGKFEFFEVDFSLTADKKIVCLHDWGEGARHSVGKSYGNPPMYAAFISDRDIGARWKNCTLDSLVAWLDKNPGKYVVTDIKSKSDFLYVLKKISTEHKKYVPQFIPQIYSPETYANVRDLGFERIILTLYRWRASDREVIKAAEELPLYAVTMPIQRACRLAPKLKKRGIPTYAHTVNDSLEFNYLKKCGVSEIYTDWLY